MRDTNFTFRNWRLVSPTQFTTFSSAVPLLLSQTIMRMMDNCSLETSAVKGIEDDLNYYVENNQEPDFAENEVMYEDLDLDDTQNGT